MEVVTMRKENWRLQSRTLHAFHGRAMLVRNSVMIDTVLSVKVSIKFHSRTTNFPTTRVVQPNSASILDAVQEAGA